MHWKELPIAGAYLVDLEKRGDDRGFFARFYCQAESAEHGLTTPVAQANDSFSGQKGTLRGMHYQLAPAAETKSVRCIRGSVWDVLLDLRPESETFGEWFGEVLDAENRKMLCIPRGCAHGFITLEDDAELLYLVDAPYTPAAERGVRWDDPRFGIEWPIEPVVLSEKDVSWPDFDPAFHLGEGRA